MNSDDEVYGRLVMYISEQTGISRYDVDRVLEEQAKFWANRPGLVDAVLESQEDDE